MKIFKNLLLSIAALAVIVAGNVHAMERPASYKYHEQPKVTTELIVARNMVDEETKKILDEKFGQRTCIKVDQLPSNVYKFYSGLFGSTSVLDQHNLIIKPAVRNNGISRIVGAQLINRCARAHNLSIRALEKKCYKDATGSLWIIAPRVKPSAKPFSLKQIKDLYKLGKLTGYQDLHAANVFNTEEGNAFAIDTEERSFLGLDISEWNVADFQYKFSSLAMEPEAREWLEAKLAKLASKQQAKAEILTGLVIVALLEVCKIS